MGTFSTCGGQSHETAQSGPDLVQRLDSIAGAGVRENRAVSIVAAVVKGNDTLLLKAYAGARTAARLRNCGTTGAVATSS